MPQWNAGDEITAAKLNLDSVIKDFTYGETIAVNDALYLKASDGKAYKTSASYNDERIYNFIGFAKESGALNDVKKVQISGKVEGFSGLTIGSNYYLSETAGAIILIPALPTSNIRFFIGKALSSTELLMTKNPGRRIIEPSNHLQHSNNASKSTTSSTYVKLKEIKVNVDYLEKIRIYFEIYSLANQTTTGIIYKNGSAIGTEKIRDSVETGWAGFNDDVGPFQKNDLIQIYVKTSQSGSVQNFRLVYTEISYHSAIDYTNQDP